MRVAAISTRASETRGVSPNHDRRTWSRSGQIRYPRLSIAELMIGIALVPCYFTIPTFLLMFAVIHVLGPCWLAWRYDTKFRPRHVTLVLGDIASWLTVFNWLSLVPCLMLTWAFASRAVVLPIWVLAMIPLFTTLAASTVGGAWIYALMIDWMRSRGKIRRASRISCSEVDA